MGGGKSKGKSKSSSRAHSMHIRRGAKGGFIATHHSDSGDPADDQEHPISDLASLHSNLDGAMGDQPPMQAPAPAPVAGPSAGAGGAAPPAGM